MAENNNARTIAAVQKMMSEMQSLVDHPRMQQRNWVARGRVWLPILQHVIEDLARQNGEEAPSSDVPQEANGGANILIKVNAGHGETYVNIDLTDVKEVTVYRGGEPGYRFERGAHSAVVLKDGRKYLTTAEDAQRVVDTMRKEDG